MSSKRNVYIALGSNIGDRLENLKQAIELIERNVGAILQKSSVYDSLAQGYASENNYLNAVILCETEKEPEEILLELQKIEIQLGRRKTKSGYEDRPIDLDIIIYENLNYKLSTPQLEIPHPRMFDRNFVIIPLLDIADIALKNQLNQIITKKTIANFMVTLKTFYIFTQ